MSKGLIWGSLNHFDLTCKCNYDEGTKDVLIMRNMPYSKCMTAQAHPHRNLPSVLSP